MAENTELLDYIYQNAQMGTESISHLIKIAEDVDFRRTLEDQLCEYQKVLDEAEEMIQRRGQSAEGVGPMAKISSYIMVELKTFTDKSPSKMAKMMLQGSTMGVLEITKRIKEYQGANKEVLNLAQDLLKTEQHNVDELKKYL